MILICRHQFKDTNICGFQNKFLEVIQMKGNGGISFGGIVLAIIVAFVIMAIVG